MNRQESWDKMEEKGLNLSEMSKVRDSFMNVYKNEHPFIKEKFNNSWDKMTFFSTHKEISQNLFLTQKEVIIANAVYESVRNNFNADEFRNQLKYIFRIIGIKSDWA